MDQELRDAMKELKDDQRETFNALLAENRHLRERVLSLELKQSAHVETTKDMLGEIKAEMHAMKTKQQEMLNVFERAKGVQWFLSDKKILAFLWALVSLLVGFFAAKMGWLGMKP